VALDVSLNESGRAVQVRETYHLKQRKGLKIRMNPKVQERQGKGSEPYAQKK